MKTFVLIGEFGLFDEKVTEVLYAGQDEDEAKGFNAEEGWHTLRLQIWVNGILATGLCKNGKKWQVEFNKIEQLEKEVFSKKEELDRMQNDLETLKREFS